MTQRISCLLAALSGVLSIFPGLAAAALIGNLESPEGFASQVGNVQGWVYTTTPGAELIQPFDVRVNGEKIMEVPCCSARGDVKGDDPDIPLQTGFSGVTNWAREAGGDPITVEVIVRDTAGGELVLSKADIEVFALKTGTPFAQALGWEADSRCDLSNSGTFTDGSADLVCTGMTIWEVGGGSGCTHGQVRFSWDKASQGFKQTSDGCLSASRWVENGDGTVTDNETGLIWEIKTNNGSVHDKDNTYTWSASTLPPNGTVFTEFLGELNRSTYDFDRERGCFAGKCDWRLPTVPELQGIVDTHCSCSTIPDGEEGPFWSLATDSFEPELALYVSLTGDLMSVQKHLSFPARAVRGGR